MTSDFAPLVRVDVALAAAYLGSLGSLLALRRWPAVPWTFLPFIALVSLPVALSLLSVLVIAPARFALRPPSISFRLALCCGGIVVVLAARESWWWLIAGLAAAFAAARSWTTRKLVCLIYASLGLALGFATVWNVNYVLAILTAGRGVDSWLVAMDTSILSVLLGPISSYDGLFPLVREPRLFGLLENSYLMLFSELLLTTLMFVFSRPSRDVARWLAVLFGTYGVGLAAFAIVPAVGPHIYQPDSFGLLYRDSLTFQAMNNMAMEYRRVIAGSPLSGFGYFVALPSLHVAAATLAQRGMRSTPWLYWTFLPINILMALSTVLLGYHYLIDVPAGVLLGFVSGRFLPPANPRGFRAP